MRGGASEKKNFKRKNGPGERRGRGRGGDHEILERTHHHYTTTDHAKPVTSCGRGGEEARESAPLGLNTLFIILQIGN